MEVLSSDKFMVFLDGEDDITRYNKPGLPIGASKGHVVNSYTELLKKLASLSYYNPRFKLLFRGQTTDYKFNRNGEIGIHSSLYPSILRSELGKDKNRLIDDRFMILRKAEDMLKTESMIPDVHKNQIVRWAMLQHYEVCPTPLLDVVQSLQTALSFAMGKNQNEGYLYILAFPQIMGPLSISIESMTQIIDLTQICPPEVLRPHFQKSLLVGDYPTVDSREAIHGRGGKLTNNFACRLLTKFHLNNCKNCSGVRLKFLKDGITN